MTTMFYHFLAPEVEHSTREENSTEKYQVLFSKPYQLT